MTLPAPLLSTNEPASDFAGAISLMTSARRRRMLLILRRPTSIIALTGILALLVLSLFGSRLAPYGADAIDPINEFAAPTSQHLFGTDDLGRDIFSRVIAATHYSITAVVVVLAFALLVGVIVGATAGYIGGLTEEILMRFTDIFLAFPGVVLALAIAAALHPGLTSAMAALAAIWWPTYARLIRGQVLAVKNNDYVDAARSLGASHTRIVTSHILRNGIAPVLVQLTLDMGNVLVTFAGLSFLGLGAEVGSAEWGAMVNEGQSYLLTNWWVATFPGLAIFLTALVLNMLGETMQEILAPGRVAYL